MEKGHKQQEEKEYKIPVSIFEAIRIIKSNPEEKSSQETEPEGKPAEKEKRAKHHHLFPFL